MNYQIYIFIFKSEGEFGIEYSVVNFLPIEHHTTTIHYIGIDDRCTCCVHVPEKSQKQTNDEAWAGPTDLASAPFSNFLR